MGEVGSFTKSSYLIVMAEETEFFSFFDAKLRTTLILLKLKIPSIPPHFKIYPRHSLLKRASQKKS